VSNLGGTDQQGLVADQVGNPNLRPERTGEFELGFDSRVLKNRVNVELTYFSKKTTDAIVVGPVAASSASPSLTSPVNVGAVQNSGLEAVVTTQLADRRSFAWDLTVTASHGTNKVTAVGPAGTLQFGNTWIAEGFPIDALFYRRYTFADASADGRIQPSEVTVDSTMRYAGYQMPRDLVSLQNGFDLFARRLRVTALIDYKGGHSVFDASNAFLCQQFLSCPDESDPSSSLTNQARAVAARYGTTIGGTPFTTAAGYLGNGQFWRFRELTATWMLPENVTRRFLRAIQASVNVGARNLHVWTHYSGVDPESNFGAGDLQNDFMTAGPPRYYTLRLNLHY
jgi:outer membrane receptor protein involved in Fe transport